jgi:hypothetical protein
MDGELRMGQALWVREAAEFEPEGEHIVCRWHGTEWIMSQAVARKVAASLSEALAKWQVDQLDRIVRLSPPAH